MSLREIKGAVTVITGASSGIGMSAAKAFARAGARVVISARREDRLRALAQEIGALPADVLMVPADVTRDEQVAALMEAARSRFGSLDILICNAGVGLYSPVADLPLESLRQAFDVNFFGSLRCIQSALPSMLPQGSGLIQLVSSVIGRRSIPGYSGYCATKFALYALAESLRVEMAGSGISVQTVYPALTDTEFAENALIRNPAPLNRQLRPMPPNEVAQHMLRAARRGTRDHIVTAGGRALALMNGVAPGLVDEIIGHMMGPKRREPGPHGDALRRE